MKTLAEYSVAPIGGIDTRRPQPQDSSNYIENMTLENDGTWSTRIGYEKFYPSMSNYVPWTTHSAVSALYVWETRYGRKTFHMHVTNGALVYTQGNPAALTVLLTGLTEPGSTEGGAHFAESGRFLVFANGHQHPKLFDGRFIRDLGWTRQPSPPVAWGVTPELAPTPAKPAPNHTNIPTPTRAPETSLLGLGSDTASAKNRYKWKVAFVSDTGSISPVSVESNTVEWVTPTTGLRYTVYMDSLPIGPAGTVARYIYRTKTLLGDDADSVYYFAGAVLNNTEVSYYDSTGDIELGSEAPSEGDSILFPIQQVHTIAMFDSCLWVAGRSDPSRIWHSLPGKPEQYTALDYHDVSSRAGGAVVVMQAYRDILYIIRERAVDIIVRREDGGYVLMPLEGGIGTVAPDTVTVIPGMGVIFLSTDGVYLLAANPSGTGLVSVEKISEGIEEIVRRQNPDLISKATATYSQKWNEWHCYFTADSQTKNNMGLVLHTNRGSWSVRGGFPVGAISTNAKGDIIFGHNLLGSNGLAEQQGLFVITRRRRLGEVVDNQELVPKAPPTSIYESAWIDFGDTRQTKAYRYVTLRIKTTGSHLLALEVFRDERWEGVTGKNHELQPSEGPSQKVYGVAKYDAVNWDGPRTVEVRFDIPATTAYAMKYRFETIDDVELVGHTFGVVSYPATLGRGRG